MVRKSSLVLCPTQLQAYDWLIESLPMGNVFHFHVKSGHGRTTVLKELHRKLGGALITVDDFVRASRKYDPLAIEDAYFEVISAAQRKHDIVIVDDMHTSANVTDGCHFYPRSGWMNAPMKVVASHAVDRGKKLIVGTDGRLTTALINRSIKFEIDRFTWHDYRHLWTALLGGKISPGLDFEKIYRFAPNLNAHQLRSAAAWCKRRKDVNSEELIEYLRTQQLTSNVALGEVSDVSLNELVGVDDVIRALEANIVLPLENDLLASELSLEPKRGVLLVGPPGTGKTTVGRALAHRLRGKFFLIDGTFISGTENFYNRIHHIFQFAKENAPSVIFIDDSDVIFESGQEHGLYRYLLTMLDGLENKTAGRVCVMMTAMDVGNLPPALIRSGRIELWLEMRLPDEAARANILRRQIAAAPPPLRAVDFARLVTSTVDFTGADLKRMIEDGKALYAFDRQANDGMRSVTEYFVDAADTIRSSKQKYSEAESRANATRPARPVWFNPYSYVE